MKRFQRWLNINKGPVIGFFALLLSYLDSILKITERCGLPQGWQVTIGTVLFVVIGVAIKGEGFHSLKIFEDIINETNETIEEIKPELEKTNEESNQSNNNEKTT